MNVFRSPGKGTFFFHLARSLDRSRQRVAPFYHDLGLDLVGSIGNFWTAAQLHNPVVEQLLKPILSFRPVLRRSWEEDDVTHILSRRWTWHRRWGGRCPEIEKDRATCVMSHVEPTCKNVMIDRSGRFLQGNDMPPACNLFFEGILLSASGSRVPVVDAESPLRKWSGSKMLVGTVCFLFRRRFAPARCASFSSM